MNSVLLNLKLSQTVDYQILYSDSSEEYTMDHDLYIDSEERIIVNETKTVGIGENGMFVIIIKDSRETTLLISSDSIHFEFLSKKISYEINSLFFVFDFTIIVSDGNDVHMVEFSPSTSYEINELSSNLYYFSYKNINKSPSDNLRKIWSLMINKIEGNNNKSKKLIEIVSNKIFDENNNTYNVIIKSNSNNINYYYYTLHNMEINIIDNFMLTDIIREKSNELINKSKPIIMMNIIAPAICAFNAYAKYSRDEIIKKYYKGDSKDKNNINRTIGRLWKKMSVAQKQKYEEISNLDKIRFHIENQLYVDEYPDIVNMPLPLGYNEFLENKMDLNNDECSTGNKIKRKLENDSFYNNLTKKVKVNNTNDQNIINNGSKHCTVSNNDEPNIYDVQSKESKESPDIISKEVKIKSEDKCELCMSRLDSSEYDNTKLAEYCTTPATNNNETSKTNADNQSDVYPFFEITNDENPFNDDHTLISDGIDTFYSSLPPINTNSNSNCLFLSFQYKYFQF